MQGHSESDRHQDSLKDWGLVRCGRRITVRLNKDRGSRGFEKAGQRGLDRSYRLTSARIKVRDF